MEEEGPILAITSELPVNLTAFSSAHVVLITIILAKVHAGRALMKGISSSTKPTPRLNDFLDEEKVTPLDLNHT